MVVVGGCVSGTRPPPHTTPKLELNFLDLENFLVKVWGGGGGGVSGARPPPPTPKLQLNFLDLEFFLVKVWGGGGGGGVSGARPPPTTPKLNSTFLDLQKWLFMPEICDDILLLPVGNYSF